METQAAPGSLYDSEKEVQSEQLLKACSKLRLRINWFGTSAKVDDETAEEMLEGTEADRKAVSIGKRIMSSGHDAIKEANTCRSDIKALVSAFTIPMLALHSADAGDKARKDAGVRLIQKKDMAEFDSQLQFRVGVLATAIGKLQAQLESVKAEDRLRLGKLYKDTDYPKDVRKLVSVEVSYEQTGVDMEWQSLCPEIYQRESLAARKKFDAVVENAAVEFATRFVGYVRQVLDSLGARSRLNPLSDYVLTRVAVPGEHGLEVKTVNVMDAEVVSKLTHADDAQIPEGSVLVELRLRVESGRSPVVWLDKPIPLADFQARLRPYETAERKKLYATVIDNLKTELDAFNNIGALLGEHQGVISEAVGRVREMLTKGSAQLHSEKIADELRSGQFFRNEMKTALEGVVGLIEGQIIDVKKVRRKIDPGLVGTV
jgi:hypothetical protein